MIYFNNVSEVFGESTMTMRDIRLKNPNLLMEAVMYEKISSMPNDKIKKFVESKEAKALIEEEIISYDTIARLNDKLAGAKDPNPAKFAVCHMASENGDPVWDELMRTRIKERELMNQLISKYATTATPIAEVINRESDKYIGKCFNGEECK